VARQLAASGCTILIGARRQIRGEEAASKLGAEDLDVHYVPIDLDDSTTMPPLPVESTWTSAASRFSSTTPA